MKTLITLAFMFICGCCYAATMTIEVSDTDVPRIEEAYGSIYNLGRLATPAEVQYMIQSWLLQSTLDYERRKNLAQFTPPPLHFSPTPTPSGLKTETAAVKATPTPKKKK
jgi:hypothetical protein